MLTLISVGLALVINFYTPDIPENTKSIKKNYAKNKMIKDFPYQYFKEELLTDEMVEFRVRVIYIYFMICVTVTFSTGPMVSPIVEQAIFSSTPTSIEILNPNQLDDQTNQQKLLLDVRGGGSDLSEFILRIFLVWTMSQNSKPTKGFQSKPINHHQHFKRQGHIQPNPRSAPKLQQNPVDRNNRGQGNCRSSSGIREKTIVSAAPSSQESNITPTPSLFAADSETGEIQNINIAFNQFKERMTQIGSQYTGQKQDYFFEQLNQCDIERFRALSTEKGRITIYNVREAESILQSEFEGFHEPNSITRATEAELQEGNVLDGRFRKGLFSGDSNTLNEQYTDVDVKLLVSDKTLQHQADQRKVLGHKNPNKTSMYEQGKNMGSSIVSQKHKHCNPNKPELQSSSDNVKHIINALELTPSETGIAQAGVLDGARIAWADQLNVPESSISDQRALQGIIVLNEDFTIERVN